MYEEILYEVDDPVATITLNRPQALNAWTPKMGLEVRHAVDAAERDPAVVGIILTGAGRAFCAGADMQNLTVLSGSRSGSGSGSGGGEFAVQGDDPITERLKVEPTDIPAELQGEYGYLLASPKPIIAAINGAVAGMAVPIAMHCDLRFMAEDAPILTAFAQRGLIGEWGLSWLLPRIAGTGAAFDLMLSSRKVSGAEAEAMGVVNKAMPAGEVLDHARDYLVDLAARCSPASIAVMKRQVNLQVHAGYAAAAADANRKMVDSFSRPDFKEGVTSFLEKRPPAFARLGE